MDLLQLYHDTISSPEYKLFIQKINGTIMSSPVQQKRCTIQIASQDEGIWVFYSNGTVRTNLGSDRLGKVSNPPPYWPSNPTVKDMIRLLEPAYKRLKIRERNVSSKYERINTNKKIQKILLYLVFNPKRLEWYDKYSNSWENINDYTAKYIINELSYEKFIDRYGALSTLKNYRIKQ